MPQSMTPKKVPTSLCPVHFVYSRARLPRTPHFIPNESSCPCSTPRPLPYPIHTYTRLRCCLRGSSTRAQVLEACRTQRQQTRGWKLARTVNHVDDNAKPASRGTIVDDAHTARLYQSSVRLCSTPWSATRFLSIIHFHTQHGCWPQRHGPTVTWTAENPQHTCGGDSCPQPSITLDRTQPSHAPAAAVWRRVKIVHHPLQLLQALLLRLLLARCPMHAGLGVCRAAAGINHLLSTFTRWRPAATCPGNCPSPCGFEEQP
jgi:hypothetical protein